MSKYTYWADGETRIQGFSHFAEARRTALYAPWANGVVRRTQAGAPAVVATAGRVVFRAPGAPYHEEEAE